MRVPGSDKYFKAIKYVTSVWISILRYSIHYNANSLEYASIITIVQQQPYNTYNNVFNFDRKF